MNFNALSVDPEGGIRLLNIDTSTTHACAAAKVDQLDCRMYEVVGLSNDIDLWVDEEGLYRKVSNEELTRMVRISRPERSPLAGVGLFLGVDPDTGATRGLTHREIERVLNWWIVTTKLGLVDA